MESQIQQKDERSISFQSQKEQIVESCNQPKEFLQIKNQFQEKQFQNKSCFSKQILKNNKDNKQANQKLTEQKKQNHNKNQQTKKLINNKEQQTEDFSKYNHIIKYLLDKKDYFNYKNSKLIKAVMILFSQGQLAALQLLGCSSQFLGQDFKKLDQAQLQKQKNLSHQEEQFAIQLSSELRLENTKKFLQKCKKQNNSTNIDLRILSSISCSISP
ncbi:hypothetical protein ABPG72_021413 [Tetrahymena utriculariae]